MDALADNSDVTIFDVIFNKFCNCLKCHQNRYIFVVIWFTFLIIVAQWEDAFHWWTKSVAAFLHLDLQKMQVVTEKYFIKIVQKKWIVFCT